MASHKSVDEFSVELLELAGLGSAMKTLHLPFGKESHKMLYEFEEHTSVYSEDTYTPADLHRVFTFTTTVLVPSADSKLLSVLVRRGDDHAKVLRGVMVWCKINAPRYFYQELDRYRIGCECLGSNSTMHQQGRGLSEDDLVEMKENLPEGTMQTRVWMFSYQTLRRIYFQRKDHRLPQWRKFCEWIETLPYAKEFITLPFKESFNEGIKGFAVGKL